MFEWMDSNVQFLFLLSSCRFKLFVRNDENIYFPLQIGFVYNLAGYADTLINAALGNRAWQSSVTNDGVASRAVDGFEDPYFHNNSCTHTEREDYSVWGVDMQAIREVQYVEALNRDASGW